MLATDAEGAVICHGRLNTWGKHRSVGAHVHILLVDFNQKHNEKIFFLSNNSLWCKKKSFDKRPLY